ncbi:MAG: putative calcineurin regulatory subunit B [Streblomastix strix]|uniref:Putative calcineurin regulatory subunit B n=1 Tax=Streblomastix strix TaxID=222440 RepID=A0A5J4WQP1_9EUKA|nr:MAG: putative calcineurin regulatory subunit B [Streblomastix strix]
MGNTKSVLEDEDFLELSINTHFTQKELKHLYKRFKKLDRTRLGSLSRADLLAIPELAMNPLSSRIITMFGTNKDDRTDFHDFALCLSKLHNGSREEKLDLAFSIYDIDGDGFVSLSDLEAVLNLMVGTNMSEEQGKEIAQSLLTECDHDGDNALSREEFFQAMAGIDIERHLTISLK